MGLSNITTQMRILVLLVFILISCTKLNRTQVIDNDLLRNLKQSLTIDGKNISEDKIKNKIVILNFWASWCGPCMEETPSLLKLINKNKNDFILISVSEDDSEKEMQKFIRLFPLAKSDNVILIHDQNRKWSQGYSVFKFPETFVYDRKLNLVKKFSGSISFQDSQIDIFFQNLITKKID